jgi:hypothetical protein
MSSTKISDLPDSSVEEEAVVSAVSIQPEFLINEKRTNKKSEWMDILVVFGLLMGATNNELSKSILRFPLLKLQKTDLLFSVLLSVIFSILFVIYKLF